MVKREPPSSDHKHGERSGEPLAEAVSESPIDSDRSQQSGSQRGIGDGVPKLSPGQLTHESLLAAAQVARAEHDEDALPGGASGDLDPVDQRLLVSELCEFLEDYLDEDSVRQVYDAYLFAAEAHIDQRRKSGEPYVYHPIAVAKILAELRLDAQSIVAAVLHDVIEDTPANKELIASRFGEDVAELVDGVSKITHLPKSSFKEAQAENFQKMLLAMTRDIRVILIKLADRLHNMRTLGAMRVDKRRRIAKETLDIYAPIANRLGINRLRLELEDLAFSYYYPWRCSILKASVEASRGHRKQVLATIETSIKRRMTLEDIPGRIQCREKHLYGIYRKMRSKDLAFNEIYDVYAVRIMVDRVDDCYRALGVMHNLHKPLPGKFKDYIAIPKANGYQSLHSVLLGPHNVPLEVQIRTEDMDQVAEIGVAAHWLYKADADNGDDNNAQARTRRWLKKLLEMQHSAGDSVEFLENVKVDLFPDEVYVFTPQGDILELPRGATAVDFAYSVHSSLGHRCVAAKVDRRVVPLHTPLVNGQSVTIITSDIERPNPAWLNFVVTGRARAAIRHFLKNLRSGEAVELGRRLLDRELGDFGLTIEQVEQVEMEEIQPLFDRLKLENFEAFLEEIGLGNRAPVLAARAVVQVLRPQAAMVAQPVDAGASKPLVIRGTEGAVVSFGRCCRPIPGDPIVAHASPGKGLVIHSSDCPNLVNAHHEDHELIEVDWADQVDAEFSSEIRVNVSNKRGVLAIVASSIAEQGANIENVSIDERDGKFSTLRFLLSVRDRDHLARVMRALRKLGSVYQIARVRS